jgi:putative glycosyltransferase (TIGR04372 family)
LFKKILDTASNPFSNKQDLNYLRYPALFIFWVINKFVYVIFKFLKIKLLAAPLEAIGHQIFDLECFFYEKKKYQFNFKPLILTSGKFIANKHLLKYQKKKYKFLEVNNKFLCLILFYQKLFKNVTFDTNSYVATRKAAKCYQILKKNDLSIKLDKSDILKAEKILRSINLKIKKKIVILHVRDNSFKPFDGETYRSSKIKNYGLAINYLLKNGYQVIRIGNQGMTKNSYGNKIFDLSKFKFDEDLQLLQLYLVNKCHFFIGTCSGPYKFATILKKPILTVDMAPMSLMFPVARKAIALPKLYKNIKTKKIINFKDVFAYNFSNLRLDKEFKALNIELIDNSPKEILEGVKEIEKLAKNKNFATSILQRRFKQLFNKDCYAFYAESNIANTFINKYKKFLK